MVENASATFALDLRDGISPSAQDAGAALARLQEQLTAGQKELNQIYAAMRRLKQGGLAGSQAFQELDSQAHALRKSLGSMQQQFVQLGGSFRPTALRQASFGFDDLFSSVARLPGPVGQLSGRLAGLTAAGPVGLAIVAVVALAAAYALLVGAIAAATVALLRYGIAQADARRSELLRLEGLASLEGGSGAALQGAIDRVSQRAALGRAEIAGYAESLHRAGLRGQTLEDALRGVSTVSAVQGEEAAKRWERMAISASRTGGSVRALADDVRNRLGPIERRMALGWDRQLERMKDGFDSLFEGLEIEGLLETLDKVTSFFSQSTESGRALKTIMTAALQPIIDFIAARGPAIERFFLGMVIAALDIAIAVVRVKNRLEDAFGGTSLGKIFDFIDAADLGQMVVYGLVGALALLLTMLIPIGIVVAAIAAPFILAAVAGVFLGKKIRELVDWLRALDWSSIGSNLIDGLVGGIRSGADRVTEAVRDLGSMATEALENALGIASPSRVFAQLGRQIPRGLALGIEDEASVADGAVSDVVSVPGAAGSRSQSVLVSIDGGIHVHVGSAEEVPDGIADRIREAIANVLEGTVIEMGAVRS